MWQCTTVHLFLCKSQNKRRCSSTDLTDLGLLENSDQQSQVLTREEREREKGQVLPRQHRPRVKHARHGY